MDVWLQDGHGFVQFEVAGDHAGWLVLAATADGARLVAAKLLETGPGGEHLMVTDLMSGGSATAPVAASAAAEPPNTQSTGYLTQHP